MAELDIFFDFDGKPIDSRAWVELQDNPLRTVATTHFADVGVTTSWVGIDGGLTHLICEGCPPLIYETIVWKPHVDPPDLNTWVASEWTDEIYRWPTREIATAGHWRIVAKLRVGVVAESDQPR